MLTIDEANNQCKVECMESGVATSEIDFSDYHSYTENDILSISPQGILLKDARYIHFRTCAQNFAHIHGGSGNCVGECDTSGSNLSFAFYTAPKTTHIFYLPQGKLKEIFSKNTTAQRFFNLKAKIESYGFTTFDMT